MSICVALIFYVCWSVDVDRITAAVGTMNVDQGSLRCREVTRHDPSCAGRLRRFRNRAARLFSNVL